MKVTKSQAVMLVCKNNIKSNITFVGCIIAGLQLLLIKAWIPVVARFCFVAIQQPLVG